MTTTRTVTCNGKAYAVRMGWNAVRRIEEELYRMRGHKVPIQDFGQEMIAGKAGVAEVGMVFWAGLETARMHEHNRPFPWTIEEVGDLIDETGSEVFFAEVYNQLLDGIREAFPKSVKGKKKSDKGNKGGDEGDPQAAAGTGNSSSTQPPA